MMVGRYLGIALVVVGLLFGVLILYGSYCASYELGLLRTWTYFGACYLVGLLLASLCSGVSSSERVVKRAAAALFGLGVVSGTSLALNAAGVMRLADTLQPWALLAACVVVGALVTVGIMGDEQSRAGHR